MTGVPAWLAILAADGAVCTVSVTPHPDRPRDELSRFTDPGGSDARFTAADLVLERHGFRLAGRWVLVPNHVSVWSQVVEREN